MSKLKVVNKYIFSSLLGVLFLPQARINTRFIQNYPWVRCRNCHNELDLPIEIIEVFDFIYSVGKSKELYPTFTCPKCGKKMIPKEK